MSELLRMLPMEFSIELFKVKMSQERVLKASLLNSKLPIII